MERLNLTLDDDTSTRLEAHAKKQGRARAALARELIREEFSIGAWGAHRNDAA
jgi:predicted transcriptional regulator